MGFARLLSMSNIIPKTHPIREAILESHDNQLQDMAELTDIELERLAQLIKMEWQGLLKIR
jgi:hypothetical protein